MSCCKTGNIISGLLCCAGLGLLFLALTPITATTFDALGRLVSSNAMPSEGVKEYPALSPHGPEQGWPHKELLGTYDRAALQRGFQVYKQVCSSCHSLRLVSYRNLTDLGFNEAETKALAADYQVTDGPNDQGEMYQRPARPSDHFVSPYANEKAARAANGGALPPDLSLIIKARHEHEDYVYSLLTGYGITPPEGEKIAEGMNYNPYFAGHQIAMPQPLNEEAVTYADGTKSTVKQMASDVVQFLTWAGEPKMEVRKETGLKTLLFLIVFSIVLYGVKRRVWKKLH